MINKDDFLAQVNMDISKMEIQSKMVLDEEKHHRSIKANYVMSVISDMFILTIVTLIIMGAFSILA